MNGFVVDASVACAWLFDDETSVPTEALLTAVASGGIVAPDLLAFEIANVATLAAKRGRIDAMPLKVALERLLALPIELERSSMPRLFEVVRLLAQKHGLTVYDAAYLDLSMQRGLPLASLDRDLREAAAAEGITILP